MSTKLALLKSGENIIADIKELVSEEKVCGYLFQNPHLVDYRIPVVLKEENKSSRDLEVSLSPWILFSEEVNIPVKSDWIVTIVEPSEPVKKMYEEKVNGQNNQTDSSDEQRNLSE